MKLADLVSYQDGSIISREIMSKKAGTISFYAFDEDQGLSGHTAPFDALVCIIDGEAEVSISGKPLRIKKGEMVILRLQIVVVIYEFRCSSLSTSL